MVIWQAISVRKAPAKAVSVAARSETVTSIVQHALHTIPALYPTRRSKFCFLPATPKITVSGWAMSRKRREPDDDGSSRYEWGGGEKGSSGLKTDSAVKKEAGAVTQDGKAADPESKDKPVPKMKLETSGLLRQAALQQESGAVVEYVASDDSVMPNKRWALYPFKGKEALDVIALHRQEWYLLGKDRDVVHIPIDHMTCSRQHAVIQFRKRESVNEFGDRLVAIKPYIMDLKSKNGTFLNKERIDSLRYIELRHQDMISFAQSTREYILLNTDVASGKEAE